MSTHKDERYLSIAECVDFMFTYPILTEGETVTKCQAVMRFDPSSVFVKPCYVQPVVSALRNTNIQIGTVIGSPDGGNTTQIKVAEAKRALTEGATLLAIPVNVGYIRESRGEALAHDLHVLSGIGHMNFAKVEVMFNPEWLENHEIFAAAQIAQSTDVDILSVPIGHRNGEWDLDLIGQLQEVIGKPVQLKGYVQNLRYSELKTLFDSGFTRLGIEYLDFIENKK